STTATFSARGLSIPPPLDRSGTGGSGAGLQGFDAPGRNDTGRPHVRTPQITRRSPPRQEGRKACYTPRGSGCLRQAFGSGPRPVPGPDSRQDLNTLPGKGHEAPIQGGAGSGGVVGALGGALDV